jgi:predicted SprT family Zn-dependent metalloprotease
MRVTNKVKADVTRKLKACIAIADKKYGRKFAMPTVKYTKRGTTAGTANDSTYTINLNPVILMENLDTFIERTVVHEFAHLVDGIVNPHTRETSVVMTRRGYRRTKRDVHGPSWKAIMRLFGAEPSRCHSYDVTNARVKNKGPRHTWKCACGGAELELNPKQHAKMIGMATNGKVTGKGWYVRHHSYKKCGGYIYEAAAKAVPVAAEAPKANPVTAGKSKLDICREWYSPSASRKDMINLFVIKAGCTPAGAATYYAKIKKEG